jgi:hypothetical protein
MTNTEKDKAEEKPSGSWLENIADLMGVVVELDDPRDKSSQLGTVYLATKDGKFAEIRLRSDLGNMCHRAITQEEYLAKAMKAVTRKEPAPPMCYGTGRS